jgi:hypothetical protein
MSKNTSARNKRLARARAQRERRSAQYPLWHNRPPYAPYAEWIRVPEGAATRGLHGAGLPPGDREFLDDLVRLGPVYAGRVPMAALYLEQQIQRGHIFIAAPGAPETDGAHRLTIAELQSDVRDPAYLAQLDEMFPQAQFAPVAGDSAEDVGHILHRLHFQGVLVMNDLHVLHPQLPGLMPAAPHA